MERYSIKINKKAENDLEDIVQYLNRFYTETALKYYHLIISEIAKLTEMRCPFVKDDTLRMRGYRCLFVKNYIVFFIVKGSTVQIRRILYNKQQYKNLV